jgi:glycosyltransferase domain-containing protein
MLTIVVPTRRRRDFLRRLLQYWASVRPQWPIIIADQGTAADQEATSELVREYLSSLAIAHLFQPDTCDFMEKIWNALTTVNTPYVVLGADDDFFSPHGLAAAVDWLEAHPDYVAAHGRSVAFHVSGERVVYGRMHQVNPYRQSSVEQETPAARVQAHFEKYSTTWYSVHRTEQLRETFERCKGFLLDPRFRELLASFLSVAQGKVRKLPEFYMARQGHAHQVSSVDSPQWLEWLTSARFAEQFEYFCDSIVDAITPPGSADVEKNRRGVIGWFRGFVLQRLADEAARDARNRMSRLESLFDARATLRRLRYLVSWTRAASRDVRTARASADFAQMTAAVREEPRAAARPRVATSS